MLADFVSRNPILGFKKIDQSAAVIPSNCEWQKVTNDREFMENHCYRIAHEKEGVDRMTARLEELVEAKSRE